MQTIYIPDAEFVGYIKGLGDKAQLIVVDGFYCWRVEQEDGVMVIAQPDEAKTK